MKPSSKNPDPIGEISESVSSKFLSNFSGAHGRFGAPTLAEWETVAPLFQAAMAAMGDMAPRTLRRFTSPLVRIAVWANSQGLPLTIDAVLDAQVIEAYCATLAVGSVDTRSMLRRLAEANGVSPSATPLGYTRRPIAAPYSVSELDALLAFAEGMTNLNRRTGLLALLALGAGAGLARKGLRGVSASSVHLHDDRLFVRSGGYCAAVRAEFTAVLNSVCKLRPTGQLIGGDHSVNVSKVHVSWIHGRVGVPELDADRLRSTYICGLISERTTVLDFMEWAGISRIQTLSNYWIHVDRPSVVCVLTGGVK
jgi:hypothetical protein